MVERGPTIFGGVNHGRFDPREIFLRHFDEIRAALNHERREGVCLFAFDGARAPLGRAWLLAERGVTRALIVGRHSQCGLPLPDEAVAASLRHLAVLVSAGPRVRLIDLHTGIGFADEAGRSLSSALIDGPAFFSIGGVVLLAMPTGAPLASDAEAAYSALPSREFTGPGPAEPAPPVSARPGVERAAVTSVSSMPSPIWESSVAIERPDEIVGEVWVRSDGPRRDRPLGRAALARGVLVGRYPRCELMDDDNHRVSRVHLLLVSDEDRLFAIDTASTNGTTFGDRKLLAEPLPDEGVLRLAGDTTLGWSLRSARRAPG